MRKYVLEIVSWIIKEDFLTKIGAIRENKLGKWFYVFECGWISLCFVYVKDKKIFLMYVHINYYLLRMMVLIDKIFCICENLKLSVELSKRRYLTKISEIRAALGIDVYLIYPDS